MPVFHSESSGDGPQLLESQPLIKVPCMDIGLDHGIELQQPEPELLSLCKAVQDELFPYLLPTGLRRYRLARVANMPAPADIIRVQNI